MNPKPLTSGFNPLKCNGAQYRVIPGPSKWQIETAVWNLASFLHCALETRFGQFFTDFLNDFLNDFLFENLHFLNENLRFSL